MIREIICFKVNNSKTLRDCLSISKLNASAIHSAIIAVQKTPSFNPWSTKYVDEFPQTVL